MLRSLFALLLTMPITAQAAECVAIEDFGGSNDGETDNGPALQSAQDDLRAEGGCILFSEGTYRFDAWVPTTLRKGDKGIELRGAGPKTELVWPGSILGLMYIYRGQSNVVVLRDLSIVSGVDGSSSNGAGVTLRKDFKEPCTAPSIIDNVVFRGADPQEHTWATALQGWGTNELTVTGSTFYGTGKQHGSGIALVDRHLGAATNRAPRVSNSRFVRTKTGILIGRNHIGGLEVDECTFDMGATGVRISGGLADIKGGGEVRVTKSLFDVTGTGIWARDAATRLQISKNNFQPHEGQWGIRLDHYEQASISNNSFTGFNQSDALGVFVGGPDSDTSTVQITGNEFVWQALGVELDTASRRVSLENNKYFATDTHYRNHGSDNSIADAPQM